MKTRSQIVIVFVAAVSGLVRAAPTDEIPSDKTVVEIAALIEQLDHDEFALREAAVEKLIAIGSTAIAALTEAARGANAEVAMRALDVLSANLENGDADAQAAARAALDQLAASDSSLARRANLLLQPIQQPTQPQIDDPFPQRILIARAPRKRVSVRIMNGIKDIEVQEEGQKIHIRDDPDAGITVEVTEGVGDKAEPKKCVAKTAAELKEKHPEAHKLYAQYAQVVAVKVADVAAGEDAIRRARQHLDETIARHTKLLEEGAGDAEMHRRIIDAIERHRAVFDGHEQKIDEMGKKLGADREQIQRKIEAQRAEALQRIDDARAKLRRPARAESIV